MKLAMKLLIDRALAGDTQAYSEFQHSYQKLPLNEAEELLNYVNLSTVQLPVAPNSIEALLVDFATLADRAAQYYDKQNNLEKARQYASMSDAYWDKAIEAYDSADAHYQKGRRYLRCWSVSTVDAHIGLTHIQKAANDFKHSGALYYLGEVYHLGKYPGEGQNPKKALAYWHKAADANHPESLYRLARLYQEGYSDILQKNALTAFEYLKKAAENNHPQAAFSLWVLYKEGVEEIPVAKNQQHATQWLSRAAQLGDPMGQYTLGQLYLQQPNVESKQQALVLLQQAAKQGVEAASELLATVMDNNTIRRPMQ